MISYMETTTTTNATEETNNVVLQTWECNGAYDSDFYAVLFNTVSEELSVIMYDTTRFPSAGDTLARYRGPTLVQALAAQRVLSSKILAQLIEADRKDILEPQDVGVGTRVVLLAPHKNQAKEHDTGACVKCEGTGLWVNPRNCADKRTCFACAGKGIAKSNERKVKTIDGKPVWVKFDPGVKGKVVWSGTFRTIYCNGYNKLGRSTISCKVLLDDGRTMSVPLEKLAIDRPLTSVERLRERADLLSKDLQFGALFPHWTWETHNYARHVIMCHQT